jgi:hypothetical protein
MFLFEGWRLPALCFFCLRLEFGLRITLEKLPIQNRWRCGAPVSNLSDVPVTARM